MTPADGAIRHSIENLLYRFAVAADDRDPVAVAVLFRDAAVDLGGQRAEGYQAVRAMFEDAFRDAPPVRHLISNVLIDVLEKDGHSRAEVRASFMRWPTYAAAGPLSLGDYVATFSAGNEGWRFERFAIIRVWAQAAPLCLGHDCVPLVANKML